jgi:hypothetical protein
VAVAEDALALVPNPTTEEERMPIVVPQQIQTLRQIIDASAESLVPFVQASAEVGSVIHTDGWAGSPWRPAATSTMSLS